MFAPLLCHQPTANIESTNHYKARRWLGGVVHPDSHTRKVYIILRYPRYRIRNLWHQYGQDMRSGSTDNLFRMLHSRTIHLLHLGASQRVLWQENQDHRCGFLLAIQFHSQLISTLRCSQLFVFAVKPPLCHSSRTTLGYYPLFISQDNLEREKDHIEGFAAECAWITHGGKSKLEKPIAVRPTSETAMYKVIMHCFALLVPFNIQNRTFMTKFNLIETFHSSAISGTMQVNPFSL
jgi:hypothetical protein